MRVIIFLTSLIANGLLLLIIYHLKQREKIFKKNQGVHDQYFQRLTKWRIAAAEVLIRRINPGNEISIFLSHLGYFEGYDLEQPDKYIEIPAMWIYTKKNSQMNEICVDLSGQIINPAPHIKSTFRTLDNDQINIPEPS